MHGRPRVCIWALTQVTVFCSTPASASWLVSAFATHAGPRALTKTEYSVPFPRRPLPALLVPRDTGPFGEKAGELARRLREVRDSRQWQSLA